MGLVAGAWPMGYTASVEGRQGRAAGGRLFPISILLDVAHALDVDAVSHFAAKPVLVRHRPIGDARVARKHDVWVARMRARSAMRKAAGRSSASEAASGDTAVVVRLGVRVPCLPDVQNGS